MTTTLKPCDTCRDETEIVMERLGDYYNNCLVAIRCLTCGRVALAHAPVLFLAKESAITAWNRRAAAPREQPAAEAYNEVWSALVPPGGYVCNICGMPVESEPCADHAPKDADGNPQYTPSYLKPAAGAEEPFGWYDHFNDCLYMKSGGKAEAERAIAGGNKVTTLYAHPAPRPAMTEAEEREAFERNLKLSYPEQVFSYERTPNSGAYLSPAIAYAWDGWRLARKQP